MLETKIKKTARTLQAEATRRKLLEVSTELIKKHGFDGVKIEEICKSAGVSVGAFYHHIKNKAGIIIESYRQCDEYFINEIFQKFEERTDLYAIVDYISYQMEYAKQTSIDVCLQVYRAQLTEGTEFFLSNERGLTKGLIDVVDRLQKANTIKKDETAEEIAEEILTISRGCIYNWCQKSGSFDLNEYGKRIVENYIQVYKI